MSWLRWHVGAVTDSKWTGVIESAGPDVTPGHCIAVWASLLERASQSRPRGSVAGLEIAEVAMALGWDATLVQRIMDAFRVRGLVREDRVAAWSKRNPGDSTAADRNKRMRARKRYGVTPKTGVDSADRYGVTVDGYAVTPSDCGAHAVTQTRYAVTPKSSSSFFSFSSALKPTSTQIPIASSAARVRASSEKLSTDAIWQVLESIGIRAGMFGRFGSGSMITHWVNRGMTAADLEAAIERARKARARQNDPSPINLRFLGCFVEDVLGGIPERGGGENWLQRGDALGRQFVEDHS